MNREVFNTKKEYRPFKLTRLPRRAGPDKPLDLFCVEMKGNHELVRTKETPAFALMNGAGGGKSAREAVQKLVDELNKVFDRYMRGEFHE